MYPLLIVIHVLICLALIIVILMQSSKGEGLAGAFGGTALTGAVFGGRGAATFLSKATSFAAIAFMVSCLVLAFVSPSRQVTKQESALKQQLQNAQPMLPADQESGLPGEAIELPAGDQQTPAGEGTTEQAPAEGE